MKFVLINISEKMKIILVEFIKFVILLVVSFFAVKYLNRNGGAQNIGALVMIVTAFASCFFNFTFQIIFISINKELAKKINLFKQTLLTAIVFLIPAIVYSLIFNGGLEAILFMLPISTILFVSYFIIQYIFDKGRKPDTSD